MLSGVENGIKERRKPNANTYSFLILPVPETESVLCERLAPSRFSCGSRLIGPNTGRSSDELECEQK